MAQAQLKNIAGIRKNSNDPPLIWTRDDKLGGNRLGELHKAFDFSSHPEWTFDNLITGSGEALPNGFWSGRTRPRWSPATGYPDNHATAEILEENKLITGDSGKTVVFWRERAPFDISNNGFNSDSRLTEYLGSDRGDFYDVNKTYDKQSGFSEVYVEFYIMISPEMVASHYNGGTGQSKVFSVWHYDGEPAKLYDFFEGKQNPNFIWDIAGGVDYGLRNFIALLSRRGANGQYTGTDQGLLTKPIVGATRSVNDFSASYWSSTRGMMPDRSDPVILNKKLNDGSTIYDSNGAADIDEVLGSGVWTKMAFYLKMNSATGVNDGVMGQWLDGQRIMYIDDIAWVSGERDMVKWNCVSIGGNDGWNTPAESPDVPIEDWYSIKDLKIYTGGVPSEIINQLGWV